MTERKYSVASIGLRIDGFLDTTLQNGGIELTYEIQDAAPSNDDFRDARRDGEVQRSRR